MHIVRKEFIADKEEGLAFASERGFGLVIAVEGARPVTSHVPFHLDIERRVLGFHVTFENPLASLADGREFVVAVAGDDSYVSNDWYATPDQISTWLYESVHLSGPARVRAVEENRSHGDRLLELCEDRLAPKVPWDLNDMEPTKREAMLQRIHFVEIQIDNIQFQRKLNQFKPDIDHVAIVNALRRQGGAAGMRLADKMQRLRPDLRYDACSKEPESRAAPRSPRHHG